MTVYKNKESNNLKGNTMNLYKLTFTSKEAWIELRNSLIQPDEDNNYTNRKVSTLQLLTGETITVNEVGHVPIPAVYDEEGNEVTPPSEHEDFAVDVVTPILIEEFSDYIVQNPPSQYYNSFTGNYILVSNEV